MKKLLKTFVFGIACIVICTGCNNDDSKDTISFEEKIKSAESSGVVTDFVFPEWLVIRINEVEKRPSSITKVQIYKGEWNKQIVYYIMDAFSSCLCDFYTEDGESADNLSDLHLTSKNWTLIYEYGELL